MNVGDIVRVSQLSWSLTYTPANGIHDPTYWNLGDMRWKVLAFGKFPSRNAPEHRQPVGDVMLSLEGAPETILFTTARFCEVVLTPTVGDIVTVINYSRTMTLQNGALRHICHGGWARTPPQWKVLAVDGVFPIEKSVTWNETKVNSVMLCLRDDPGHVMFIDADYCRFVSR